MSRFSVERRDRSGVEQITLRDRSRGAEAAIVPARGGACVAFRVQRWSVLSEPPDDDALLNRTSRYGVPILYPWPNRIASGRFSFRGRSFQVPAKGEHANHGLARDLPFSVVDAGVDPEGAFLRSRVTIAHPAFPSVLEVEHRLLEDTLRISASAENTGAEAIPMGYGLHPYFEIPAEYRGRCTVTLPASGAWELDRFIPTGRILPRTDLREPRALGDDAFDDVFTGLDRPFAAALHDPVAGRTVVVRSDRAFREHVLYAPPDRPVVCLEPYTCPTDAFNLEARGIPAGVVMLEPGERWSGAVSIQASTEHDG